MKIGRFILKGIKIKNLFSLIFLLSFFVYFVSASEFKIQAPATIYKWCVQPYIVQMDMDGSETKSIDLKVFLTWYFSITDDKTEFDDAISGNIYANYIEWIVFDSLSIQTGVANSGGAYQWWEYLYLNWFQGFNWFVVTGDDLSIATLYLKANNFDTWYLDFYYVTGRNGDDSNISSGINAGAGGTYTSYLDSLASVSNIDKALSGASTCTSKPYISDAKYRQTWYVSTSTGVQAVWTSVIAWPFYSGDTSRIVWTNWDVKLALTWVSDAYADDGWLVQDNLSTGIKINDTLVSAFTDDYISRIDTNTWWMHQYYEVLISGNISTWFAWFENILWNTGSTYTTGSNNYNDEFNIDVFWIDTIIPTKENYFTGYISDSGGVTTTYTLSGINYSGSISGPLSWFHADWTDKDDQYKVISFSGTNPVNANCVEVGYDCYDTGYMNYLNATGYVRSGDNIFKLEHDIVFTNSFSGIVTVIDRAGNTWEWDIDISMEDNIIVGYGLIAYPQAWVERNELIQLSGMLMKLAIYSGWFNKERLLWSGWWGIDLVYTGWIKTSNTGYAAFTGNFASGNYHVLVEWVNTLSYMISWVSLSPVWWTIDYTQVYTSWFLFWDTYGIVTTLWSKNASYLSDGADRDSIINVNDLANIVTIWWEYWIMNSNSEIWVYSWEYFVDKPSAWTWTKIESSLLQTTQYTSEYMQYHPYDVNANGIVDVADYALINSSYNKTWYTNGGKLDWAISATMPF